MPDILKIKIAKTKKCSFLVELWETDSKEDFINKFPDKHIKQFISSFNEFDFNLFCKETQIVLKCYFLWKHLTNA